MGCPGNPQLAFKLQHELWVSPEKQGSGDGLGSPPPPSPLLLASTIFSGEVWVPLSRTT